LILSELREYVPIMYLIFSFKAKISYICAFTLAIFSTVKKTSYLIQLAFEIYINFYKQSISLGVSSILLCILLDFPIRLTRTLAKHSNHINTSLLFIEANILNVPQFIQCGFYNSSVYASYIVPYNI
jgi:hypothetical protein